MKKNSTAQKRNKGNADSAWQGMEGLTVGIDLGDKRSYYCVLDSAGEKVAEGSLSNTATSLTKHFGGLGRARIALETGTQSGWISRELEGLGHEVLVANARELRAISGSGKRGLEVVKKFKKRPNPAAKSFGFNSFFSRISIFSQFPEPFTESPQVFASRPITIT